MEPDFWLLYGFPLLPPIWTPIPHSNTPTLGRRKRSQRGRGASILLAYFPLTRGIEFLRANYLFHLLYPLIWPVNSVTSAVEFSWVVVRSQELQKSEASTDLGKAVRHWQEKLEEGQGKCTQVFNMASKGMTSSQWVLWEEAEWGKLSCASRGIVFDPI